MRGQAQGGVHQGAQRGRRLRHREGVQGRARACLSEGPHRGVPGRRDPGGLHRAQRDLHREQGEAVQEGAQEGAACRY